VECFKKHQEIARGNSIFKNTEKTMLMSVKKKIDSGDDASHSPPHFTIRVAAKSNLIE